MAAQYPEHSKLERIEDKLDKVVDTIGSINVTLARQEEQLATHIKRTNILESKLEPVERHVVLVGGAFKFIGLVATIGAIVEAAVTALTYLKS